MPFDAGAVAAHEEDLRQQRVEGHRAGADGVAEDRRGGAVGRVSVEAGRCRRLAVAQLVRLGFRQGQRRDVVQRGWKARTEQINQGPGRANRVIFMPSKADGSSGAIVNRERSRISCNSADKRQMAFAR